VPQLQRLDIPHPCNDGRSRETNRNVGTKCLEVGLCSVHAVASRAEPIVLSVKTAMFRQWTCCPAADDDDVRTEGKSCVKANVHVSTEFLSVRRTRRGMRATVYRRLCLQSAATFCRQHLDSDGATTNFKRTRSFLTYFRRQICRRKSVECRPIYAQQRS